MACSTLVVDQTAPTTTHDGCRSTSPDWSVARVWNEELLDAIRLDTTAPTVHARNLFHLSVAMWDAWAAYDGDATGYLIDEDHDADHLAAEREEAMSHAAYALLRSRYQHSVNLYAIMDGLDETMRALCYPIDLDTIDGDSPVALGNRIARAVIALGLDDGANEAGGYVDPTYAPANEPLTVALSGTVMVDPNRWQPLLIGDAIDQAGGDAPDLQVFIGSQWGRVTGFALEPSPLGLPVDPGTPPRFGDSATGGAFVDSAVEVIEYSSRLDPSDGAMIDIGPGALGNNPLGTNDGTGYGTNPVTGEAYAPNLVPRADFGRVLAEFWADGPQSETPPGHWNTIANDVSDDPALEHRIGGTGPEVGRLEWDVKLYLALNGAVHDAAVAAWGAKRHYDYARPISMIRYLGGLGQSTDPSGPSYNPAGLPLIDGLIEVITPESTAAGERHQHLEFNLGEIAVRSWTNGSVTGVPGVGWILARDWSTYQRQTFVTPSFAAYVSGHSTFSRAGAEVLTAITGSPWFPGGLGSHTVPVGELEFEDGPTTDVVLQWASYYDASDQAGLSRLYGGIHVRADDLDGRVLGSRLGIAAWAKAFTYFD